jgi:hypothetical protein
MSLAEPVARRHLHTRTIVCEGFLRDDGLYDIEASIVDTKSYRYTEPMRGVREAGSAVHDMRVRLTICTEMIVRDIEVVMPSTPYPACQSAPPNFRGLIGAKVGSGWRRAVEACVGATRGCTHVRELLFPMATVAFQTLGGWTPDDGTRGVRVDPPSRGGKPYFIDGCISWAANGEVVRQMYPQFAEPRGD